MTDERTRDEWFRAAVSAIDAGDVDTLRSMLVQHPSLLRDRLDAPGEWLRRQVAGALDGFFNAPYLLWLIAEDPVRNDTLPRNVADVARVIVEAAQRENVSSLQEQLDYALSLVAWSWVAHRCGVQIALIDTLIDAGASPNGVPDNALVNGHFAAAERLLQRGAKLTLATAVCIGRWDALVALHAQTSRREKQMALTLAALNGRSEGIVRLLQLADVDVNAVSQDLYSHAPPLHHAVCSGSLDAVKALVEAGAHLTTKDSAHGGTPLGWAEHYRSEQTDAAAIARYATIEEYLRTVSA